MPGRSSRAHGWPMIDVSRRSIEETAAAIVALRGKNAVALPDKHWHGGSHGRKNSACLGQPVPQGDAGGGGRRHRRRAGQDRRARGREAPLEGTGASPEDVAQVLAEAKALEVSERNSGAAGDRLRPDAVARRRAVPQAEDMEDARRHLLKLSGRTHQLNSAAVWPATARRSGGMSASPA